VREVRKMCESNGASHSNIDCGNLRQRRSEKADRAISEDFGQVDLCNDVRDE